MLTVVGACDLHDAVYPEQVPEPVFIGIDTKESGMVRGRTWKSFSDDPEVNWQAIQPALTILRRTCPEAADWVVARHDTGQIHWSRGGGDVLALYDNIDGCLTIRSTMVGRQDGENAVTLAHEFRHSRQKKTKLVKRLILSMLTQTDQEAVAETDAYDYERQVYLALYGY